LVTSWAQEPDDHSGYYLTVNNGVGTGRYEAGETVSITASDKEGFQFIKWIKEDGSTGRVDHLYRSNTTFAMPAKSAKLVAVFAKIEGWFPVIEDDETIKIWLLLQKPKEGESYIRFPHRARVTIDSGPTLSKEKAFKNIQVKLGWFPSPSAEGSWHSDELVRYWDTETEDTSIQRDSVLQKSIFKEKSPGVFEATVWYSGDWSPKDFGEDPYVAPEAHTGFKLLAHGTNYDQVVATTSENLLKVDIKEVYEKDQVWNKVPHPREPGYINKFENPEEPLSEKELNNRLFLAVEPPSGKIEVVVELEDELASDLQDYLLCGLENERTGELLDSFASFQNSLEPDEGSFSELSVTPTGSAEDDVFVVVLGFDKNSDGALSESELINSGGDSAQFSLTIITEGDVDAAHSSLLITTARHINGVVGDYSRYFLGEQNGIPETTTIDSVAYPIGDHSIQMIAGAFYDQSSGEVIVPTFHSDTQSSYAELMRKFFAEDGSRGLYQLVQRTWKHHANDIWNHFETNGDSESLFTFSLREEDSLVNFYYGSTYGFNGPRYSWGLSRAYGGTVSLSLYRDGDRVYARLIGLKTTLVDVYDFDFTQARGTASRHGGIIQISFDEERDQGRIFRSEIDVSLSFTDQTDLGPFRQPLEYFNENTYIDNGTPIYIPDAGSGVAPGYFFLD